MNKLFYFLLICLLPVIGYSQSFQVSGKVTDAAGHPIPGVTVQTQTKTVAFTDSQGNYTIGCRSGDVLTFSFVGMLAQNITVESERNIDVELKEDSQSLEDVVVVGYGTMRKSDISGSSVSVGERAIKTSTITNLDQVLQGRAAGVTSVLTSGAPGSAVKINIRGQSTINAGSMPLYVIDGIPVGGSTNSWDIGLGGSQGNGSESSISPLSLINPQDILSMEILKDASATAIYGSRGSNGVVLITTKRGRSGEAKFSYEGSAGFQAQMKRLKLMNLREFAEYSASVSAETSSLTDDVEFQDPSLLGKGTSWQDAVFQNAFITQHQISAQGGSDKVKYYVSGSMMDQEGTIIGTKFNRFSGRVNLDVELKSWLKLGINSMYSRTSERMSLANGDEGIITYSLTTPPDIPIYDIDNNYATEFREGNPRPNPIGLSMMNDILLGRDKLNGSIFFDISPIKELVWHTELGFDFGNSRAETFYPMYDFGKNQKREANRGSVQKNSDTWWQVKNYLTYTGNIKKHSFTAMLGQEAWESKWDHIYGYSSGLPSDDIHNPQLGDPDSYNVTSGFGSAAMASFFTRETYNYDDRYLFTYTYRYDGSSNFGPKNRWAGFHSFAGSWKFTNEAFLKGLSPAISSGKIRLGWGQTGNQGIGGYRWGAAISQMPSGFGQGYRQSNIANPYVRWETQEQWNLGFDLGFLNERINLTVELYDKVSKDMLMRLQLPSYMGTKGNGSSALAAPMGNYGSMQNKGLEIILNTRNMVGAFEWTTDFQISFNKNKLLKYDGVLLGWPQWGGVGAEITKTEVGRSLYGFFGFVTDGYYRDLADLESSPKDVSTYPSNGKFNVYNTLWVGDVKFKDLNNDGVIDDNDRTYIGSPFPKFTFGMTNTFRYKNFDLTIFLNGVYGNKVYNFTAVNLSSMNGIWTNQLQLVTNRVRIEPIDRNKVYDGTDEIWNWFEDISNVRLADGDFKAPRAKQGDPGRNTRISDRYIEDGSYLRISNIVLGYTVPSKITSKLKIDNVRLYVNLQNLYTFTKYTGYDPEIGVNTHMDNVFGMDNGRYPSPSSFTFGLNFSF